MDDLTKDPVQLPDSAVGHVNRDDPSRPRLLTLAGEDIVAHETGGKLYVGWCPDRDDDLFIVFDDPSMLSKNTKTQNQGFRVKKSSRTDPEVFRLHKPEDNASYYYSADLLMQEGERRDPLAGKATSEDRMAEANTASDAFATADASATEDVESIPRPRIKVGTGGPIAP